MYAISKRPFEGPQIIKLTPAQLLQAVRLGARLYSTRKSAEKTLTDQSKVRHVYFRAVQTSQGTYLWLSVHPRSKEEPMSTPTSERQRRFTAFQKVIRARVTRAQAFYGTPIDRGVAAAARATGGYARRYYQDMITRMRQSGPKVQDRIRSWFTPNEEGQHSRAQKVGIAVLNILSIPGFAVYSTLEVAAAAVMTAVMVPVTAAIGLVRIAGWVLLTVAYLVASAAALVIMAAAWLIGVVVLAVLAVTAVVALLVSVVAFSLDRLARWLAPFKVPSLRGTVTEHLLADDVPDTTEATEEKPAPAPRRMRTVTPQSA